MPENIAAITEVEGLVLTLSETNSAESRKRLGEILYSIRYMDQRYVDTIATHYLYALYKHYSLENKIPNETHSILLDHGRLFILALQILPQAKT